MQVSEETVGIFANVSEFRGRTKSLLVCKAENKRYRPESLTSIVLLLIDTMASPPEEVSNTDSSQAPPQWEPPVTCVLCSGELNDPYLLACLHCLCKECLPRAANEEGRLKCPAPNCGDSSTTWQQPDVVAFSPCEERVSAECVPVQCATVSRYMGSKKIVRKITSGERIDCNNPNCQNAESGAAKATALCFDCCHFICSSCQTGHKIMEAYMGKHDIKLLDLLKEQCHKGLLCKAVPLYCPRHKGKVLEYHCEVCDLLMCQACTVDKDSPHRPTYLSTEVPLRPQHLHAVELAQKVAACSKEQCRVARETAEGWGTEVERNKEEALRDVQQSFQAYQALLEHRKEELCEKIRSASETRKESITGTVHLYRQKEDFFSNRQAMLSFLSTEGSPHEVISYRRVVNTESAHCRSEAVVSRVMKFLPKQEAALREAIEGFGRVEVGACSASSTLEPAPENVCKCSDNDAVVFTLTTADNEKTPCSVGGERVQAFLRPRPPIPGPPIKAVVNDEENGQYKVTFDLTYTGECELSVLVNGAHIRGSPFEVELDPVTDVRLLLTRDVSTLGDCKGTLQFPQEPGQLWGVAVARNGTIFVTDYDNHQIHVFDVDRKYVRSLGEEGDGDGQLQSPKGIAITTEGLLYVASDKRVDVLKQNGVFVRRIGAGRLANPYDVTVYKGEVFVVDCGNSYVAVFDPAGKFKCTVGSEGTGPAQFRNPQGIAISADGEMHVYDYNNDCVKVLTTRGVYIREFGKMEVRYAHKMLFAGTKHVLVADKDKGIAVYDPAGTLVKCLDCDGYPRGLAVDQKGDLLVVCSTDKCVRIF